MGAFLTWTPKAGPSQNLFFDVVTEEAQDLAATMTEHPIEDGANIADHVRDELEKVTLEVFVSNQPVEDVNGRGGKVDRVEIKLQKYKPPLELTPGSVFTAVGGAISTLFSGNKEYGASVLQWTTPFDAVAETLATLETLKSTKQTLHVVLPSKDYESMLLTHIGMQRNAQSGGGAVFKLDFQEVRKVRVSIVAAPKATELRGNVKKPKGAQGAKPAAAPEQKKSIAKAVVSELPQSVLDFMAQFKK